MYETSACELYRGAEGCWPLTGVKLLIIFFTKVNVIFVSIARNTHDLRSLETNETKLFSKEIYSIGCKYTSKAE